MVAPIGRATRPAVAPARPHLSASAYIKRSVVVQPTVASCRGTRHMLPRHCVSADHQDIVLTAVPDGPPRAIIRQLTDAPAFRGPPDAGPSYKCGICGHVLAADVPERA